MLMPDHLHWLFQLRRGGLAEIVSRFKGRRARKINEHCGKRGKVWQTAYHDHALREDEDIRKVARYLVANPLRAGLVNKIEEYPHWDAWWDLGVIDAVSRLKPLLPEL